MSDQTPPERIAELEDRIEQLDATIRKMLPSRREALGMGVAGLAGASLMSGTASAGSAQVGTIGDSNNLVDIEAEDVNVSDTINGASVSGAQAGEALTSDGSGGLTFAEVGGGIPPNFSYVDEESNRSLFTTFTNNTGKTLFVSVICRPDTNATSDIGMFVQINGVIIQHVRHRFNTGEYDSNARIYLNFFVPDGSTYEVNGQGDASIHNWYEAEM